MPARATSSLKPQASALNRSITLDDINRAKGYSANYFKLPRLNINVELRQKIAQHAKKIASENQFIAGVILFGSIARGEETEQSDVDLLILWEKLNVDPRKRHVYIYKTVSKYFPPNLRLTVLDMEYNSLLKTTKLTPLLLNR